MYAKLLKKSLLGYLEQDGYMKPASREIYPFDPDLRDGGKDWPTKALTMIGMKRMNNLQTCVEDVLNNNVVGDFIETGVWRGGACIFMEGLLKYHDQLSRRLFVADSFCGLPAPQIANDIDFRPHNDVLSVDLETVKANFERYDLLENNVRFVEGYFEDTMETLKNEKWAILRLDGDMYSSTKVVLDNLYQGLSAGGYIIVDDYFIPQCRLALDEYREKHGISNEIMPIDDESVYWRK